MIEPIKPHYPQRFTLPLRHPIRRGLPRRRIRQIIPNSLSRNNDISAAEYHRQRHVGDVFIPEDVLAPEEATGYRVADQRVLRGEVVEHVLAGEGGFTTGLWMLVSCC